MNLDRRLLDQLRSVRALFGLTVGLGFTSGLLLVAQAYGLSQVIDRAFVAGESLSEVQGLLIALSIIALVRSLALWARDVTAHHLAGRIKIQLRARLVARLLALGPGVIRQQRSGELANTVSSGVEELDAYFSQYLPQLVLAVIVPLAMLVVVFPLDLLSGFILLVTAPLIPLFMVLIASLADHLTRRQWTQLSRMSAHFLDALQGLATLKVFGRCRDQVAIIQQVSDRFRDATLRVLRVAFVSALVLELVSTLSTAIIAVEIGLRLLYARMPFDQALFILILAPEFYLPLRLLGTRFHAGMSGAAAATRIFEILTTPLPPCSQHPTGVTNLPHLNPGRIRFTDVDYAYERGDQPGVDSVTFSIIPGETVALVGPSGAGKSTITQLLLKFIAPQSGTIEVDGHDLCHLPTRAWREQIAWVPQQPYLFAASIADNIRLARPNASLTEVIAAARHARADGFVTQLPQGYDTPIGERGARLSGGQAQRIALARAFLKDAPVLILDEVTSHLDPVTEAALRAAMADLMQNRTALIIAHRLQTVQAAGRIIVMDAGRVVQIGTHAQLSARPGLYSRLVAATGGPMPAANRG